MWVVAKIKNNHSKIFQQALSRKAKDKIIFYEPKIIYEKFQSFDLKFIPIILIMIVSGWGILFVRWNLLLKNQSIIIPTRQNFLIYLAGFALAISPLKSGAGRESAAVTSIVIVAIVIAFAGQKSSYAFTAKV